MPPKERLTVTEHLPKYGADAAFYTNTEEGASIICKPLPYCRLRGDTRQKVLEYLVCVSDKSGERHALRAQPDSNVRADMIDDPAPPKAVRVVAGVCCDVPLSRGILKHSTAAAVDTLIKHSSVLPAVCRTMQLDYKSVVARPAAMNRAVPRAWLENLYCRPSVGMDDRAVKEELIARQKAGKMANLTRVLLRRSAASVEFRHARWSMGGATSHLSRVGTAGGATDGVQVFRPPSAWTPAQKEGASRLLANSQMSGYYSQLQVGDPRRDNSKGLAMTHSRVLTVDEANAEEPCDIAHLTQLTKFALTGVIDHLKGRTLTVLVTRAKVVQHHLNPYAVHDAGMMQAVLTSDDYEAMGTELRGILGSVAADHRLPTAWTNKVPHPYEQFEQRPGALGKDDFRAACHDASEPPIKSYAELLRLMAETNVGSVSLDQEAEGSGGVLSWKTDYDEKTLFAPQGATRVDIAVPADASLKAQRIPVTLQHKDPYPVNYIVDAASVKGARPGSAVFGGNSIEFKINTNVLHERGHLEDGYLFVDFGHTAEHGIPRFGVCMDIKIPGMD